MPPSDRRRFPTTVVAAALIASSAHAAAPTALTWDADPATPGIQDGAGTWDTVLPNFFATTNTSNYAYDNAANHDVRFGNGGTPGVVTIGTGVAAHSLSFGPVAFGVNRYTLAATGMAGLTLTENGATDPSITTDSPAEITAPITSSAATITKLGTGLLILSGSNSYTGTLRIAAGSIFAPSPSVLPGSGEGRLAVLSAGRLSVIMANDATGWQDADVTTLVNTTPFAAASGFSIGVASGSVTYNGRLPATTHFTKSGTGTLVLTSAQTGPTMIALSGALALTGAGRLPAASAISFNTPVTLTVGANVDQSIALFERIGSISASMTINGAGTLTATPGFAFASTVVNDLSGLAAFTYNQSTALNVGGKDTTVKLAAISSVTAPGLNVGTENPTFDPTPPAASLVLGVTSTFNVDTIQIGTSRATGSVSAAGAGSLVLRGRNGSGRVGNVTVGFNRDSYNPQTATFNVGVFNFDAQIGTLAIAGSQNGWGNISGTVAMTNGTLDATAINMAYTTGSSPSANGTTTARFEQNGGVVRAGQLTMCGLTYSQFSGDFKQVATYVLGTAASPATLAAGSITGGALPNATTINASRTLAFNNGRLTTLNANTDLIVIGASGGTSASYRPLNIVLSATGLHAVTAPAGRAMRIMDTAPISGSGTLTIDGVGTVYLSAANTYTGGTVVTNGMLRANKAAHAALLSNGGTDVRGGQAVFTYLTAADNPAATIRSLLTTGNATGFATGTLRSTTAVPLHGLGYIDSGTGVTVMYTLYGDNDLDGGVSINDFNALSSNFGATSGKTWADGDYDYDGSVSINDFNLLAGNFGQSLSGPVAAVDFIGLLAFAATHDDLVTFEVTTGVPEPGSIGLLAAGAVLRRRRRA